MNWMNISLKWDKKHKNNKKVRKIKWKSKSKTNLTKNKKSNNLNDCQ
jgi:hypothetical protein